MRWKKDFVANVAGEYFNTTQERTKKLYEGQIKAQKTNESISPERKSQQEESKKKAAYKKNLEVRILALYPVLLNKIVACIKKHGLEKTLEDNADVLKKFKEKCDESKQLKIANKQAVEYTKYDELIGEISKIDPHIVLFCDIETFPAEYSTAFGKLSDEDRAIVQKRLEEQGLFNTDSTLIKKIKRYFPEHFNAQLRENLTRMNSTEVMRALRVDPSLFVHLTSSQLEPYENPLKDALHKAVFANPALILYLPENLIHQLINQNTRAFLAALMAHPEVLDKLSPNFFYRHEVVLGKIFTGSRVPATKQKFADTLGSRIERFPELESFFADCTISTHSI